MDGKWHPEWEEPEEGAKNNIADISYLTDDRAYSMPDLGDRPEDVRISDGWTQTMPDGDHAVQVDFLLQEIQARKVAFDHMCNAVKKQKVVVDSDMHVMLMSMSAMNKRLKAVFKQVDDGEEYNAAIDRQFSMDYEVADVIIDNEPEAFEGSDGEEQTDVASGPSNATGSASTIIPTPANGSNRRRMLPRLAAYIPKGPPEGMVCIDEINLTQLDALAGRGQGEFDDDVDENDEEEQDEFDKSGEKLRLETEAGATQDSTYTPEIEASPSTVGSKGTDGLCSDDIDVIKRGRIPSAKAVAQAAQNKLKEANPKPMFKRPISVRPAGSLTFDSTKPPDPKDFMKIFPRPDFNIFRVDQLKMCMAENKMVVGKSSRKADMVEKCARKWDDLHPISSGPRIDQELLKLSKIAAEEGLIKPKGNKTGLQEWNEQQEATRHWKAQLKGGRRTTSDGPTSSRSTSSGATSSGSTTSGATSSRSTSSGAISSGATSTHDARGREKKRLLLEKTIDEEPRPLESPKTKETVDLTGEKGSSPSNVFGSPSIEATFAELEEALGHLGDPSNKRSRWSQCSDEESPVAPASSPVASPPVAQLVASSKVACAPVDSAAVASPPIATPPEVEDAAQNAARVLSADMSTASTQSMLSADSDGGEFDSATFFNKVKR